MTFGDRLVYVRMSKKLSQSNIGKMIGVNGDTYGRYECDKAIPSVEIARNIADILDVSLDYLTGKTDVEMDKDIKKRILEVSKFDDEDRESLYSVIDAFIAKRKIQSIL